MYEFLKLYFFQEFPERHDVAVDTSHTLERQYQEIIKNKNKVKEKEKVNDKEKKRERKFSERTDDKKTNLPMHIEFEEFDPESSLTRNTTSTEFKNGFKRERRKNEGETKTIIFNLKQTFSRSESDLLRQTAEPARERNPSISNLTYSSNSALKMKLLKSKISLF